MYEVVTDGEHLTIIHRPGAGIHELARVPAADAMAVREIKAERDRLAKDRDALLAVLEAMTEGINDEWHPLFHGNERMSEEELALLVLAEETIRTVKEAPCTRP